MRSKLRQITTQSLWAVISFAVSLPAFAQGSRTAVADAIALVQSVESGRKLLDRSAEALGLRSPAELEWAVVTGKISHTEASLIRHFDSQTGTERQERKLTVHINTDQSVEQIALDLAHELTHASARPSWNPYDPKLTIERYVELNLEGPGGEVEAVTTECTIAAELEMRVDLRTHRCDRYFFRDERLVQVEKERILNDFYRVGLYLEAIETHLGYEPHARFPRLSSRSPLLISSTGRVPYPLALINEYEELNRTACDNTRRRLLSGQSEGNEDAIEFLRARCRSEKISPRVARNPAKLVES